MANKSVEIKETTPIVESKYTISDFVSVYEKFNTSDIIVKTALELSGKTEFTMNEAEKIIEKFKNKEV